ncbi:1,4-dihydroxy-2-naphthoate octaprenyltransferase [Halorhodospira abdelmalekii]|uniref:1,4-dihydroxy-2-naphthoate octaprenyltransferase n=1 Tax=Halorhodospira abdelmalekii TaxID=421629 RepID=UPI001904C0EF|nr:1,4-dihydroxy-2-naphthoate octaprenyltransferase [Halorhodospira abdelmalekii]MBK1733762.1 1,4-dihydroxy-2-naphthoate octaprenyltransferase [Halorhodospira abdelmalekii]
METTATSNREPRPGWPLVLWYAIRPRTLPLSLSPVLAGSAVGWVESGVLRLDVTLVAALVIAIIQIGTNLQNDAADTLNATDQAGRVGPLRVTERGWLTPRQVLTGAFAAYGVGLLLGVYLIYLGGWPIVVLGLLSVLAAFAYSGGPWPISRGPFGELVVILFFGLVAVGGVAYLYGAPITWKVLLIALIVGVPAAAVLLVNNLRDRQSDARAGRRTLAILLGRERALWLFGGFLLFVTVGLLVVATAGPPWVGVALGLAGVPLGVRVWRALIHAEEPATYNSCLARTALFQLLVTVTMTLGLVLAVAVG